MTTLRRFTGELSSLAWVAFTLLLSLFVTRLAWPETLAPQAGQPPAMRFELAAIHPIAPNDPRHISPIQQQPGGRLRVEGARLRDVIEWAYSLRAGQRVLGRQEVLDSRFVITAMAATDLPLGRLSEKDTPFKLMTQSLLRDRFGLRVSWFGEEQNAMVVRRVSSTSLGPNIKPLKGPCKDVIASTTPVLRADGTTQPRRCGTFGINGRFHGAGDRGLESVLDLLSALASVRFVDETGLSGGFEVTLSFDLSSLIPGATGDRELPSFADALRDQLGLRVERRKALVQMLRVEEVHPPTEN